MNDQTDNQAIIHQKMEQDNLEVSVWVCTHPMAIYRKSYLAGSKYFVRMRN